VNVYYVMAIWVGMALLAFFISIRVGISTALVGGQAESNLCRFVMRAREPKATWATIEASLGMTRQSAW
jgi:hypothetical protein